ncbi:NAD(P)/FAD-dependent oxidoreductase [Pedococcus sp. KACC 23699]|uniref:NAD(P)/FAD-dependent oxidoreductase n=1 Tax=Pedococcus sp. KACC 23699 TaxID=3149228 RepID=A0AAU7JSM9_9MICO
MSEYDVVVVGGSAAGLSAALVLSRARRRVLVVDSGAPRNAPASHMHGFLSRDGVPPPDLLAVGRHEVRTYGGEVREGSVTHVARADPGEFTVSLSDGREVSSRRLVLATGLRDELPDLPGLSDRWGRDVLHCPYCHGREVEDQPLGVLGDGPDSVRYAQIVRQWSDDVVLFIPAGVVSAEQRIGLDARGVQVVEGVVNGVTVEDDRLTGVTLADGSTVERAAVFLPPHLVPNNDLAAQLDCALDPDGWVVTDAAGATSVTGVWAAGNVTNPKAQVVTAAGEGSAAAIDLNADLVDEDVRVAADSAR